MSTGGVLGAAEKLRPLLKKVIPQTVLSDLKAKAILGNIPKIEKQLTPFDRSARPAGVNLIGNIKAPTGLGQSMRLVGQILQAGGVPFAVQPWVVPSDAATEPDPFASLETDKDRYGVNLIHVNPSEFPLPFLDLGTERFSGHYNIAYWLWELQEFPQEWKACIRLADEIWTPSGFITDTIRKVTDKPVLTVPYPVQTAADPAWDRKRFGLPEDRFLFLVMYDGGSGAARKNPAAAIEAYRKAFAGREDEAPEPDGRERDRKVKGSGLVLKVHEETPQQAAERERLCEGLEHVYVIGGNLPKPQVDALTRACDAFVSLHRAEGFGLVMAEAMELGTPVVATDWSANTEFMDESCACMVPCALEEIAHQTGAFRKGMHWAAPDTQAAAGFMRRLYTDTEFYDKIKRTASEAVKNRLSLNVPAEKAAERIRTICSGGLHDRGQNDKRY